MNSRDLLSMLPQVAVGGCTPSPRKLSAASMSITKPILRASVTMVSEKTLGMMCTRMKPQV